MTRGPRADENLKGNPMGKTSVGKPQPFLPYSFSTSSRSHLK
ncbi:hypothetical protein K3495_g6525 [Podosphaera aphanis]|nr:hypothetical protein K3495_g6525 [Podosphaera aphanis]